MSRTYNSTGAPLRLAWMVDNQFIWAPWKAPQNHTRWYWHVERKGLSRITPPWKIIYQDLKSRSYIAPAVFVSLYILYILYPSKVRNLSFATLNICVPWWMDHSLQCYMGGESHFQTSRNRRVNWSSMRLHVFNYCWFKKSGTSW